MSNKTLQINKTRDETLLALLTNKTKVAAADRLGIDRSTLDDRIKKFGLDEVIADIPNQALQQLQLGSIRAAEVMVEELENRPNKMEAAKEILDRTGVTKKEPKMLQQFNIGGEMKLEFIKE